MGDPLEGTIKEVGAPVHPVEEARKHGYFERSKDEGTANRPKKKSTFIAELIRGVLPSPNKDSDK